MVKVSTATLNQCPRTTHVIQTRLKRKAPWRRGSTSSLTDYCVIIVVACVPSLGNLFHCVILLLMYLFFMVPASSTREIRERITLRRRCVTSQKSAAKETTVNSLLRTPLQDGHLFKTDTLCRSRPFFSHFTVIKPPLRWTPLKVGQRTL